MGKAGRQARKWISSSPEVVVADRAPSCRLGKVMNLLLKHLVFLGIS